MAKNTDLNRQRDENTPPEGDSASHNIEHQGDIIKNANVLEVAPETMTIMQRVRGAASEVVPDIVKNWAKSTQEAIQNVARDLGSRIPDEYKGAFNRAVQMLTVGAAGVAPIMLIPSGEAAAKTIQEIQADSGVLGAQRAEDYESLLEQWLGTGSDIVSGIGNEFLLVVATGAIGGITGKFTARGSWSIDDILWKIGYFSGGQLLIRHGFGLDPGLWWTVIISALLSGGLIIHKKRTKG